VRTPLRLVPEGDGRFTLFYTGFEETPDWPRKAAALSDAQAPPGADKVSSQDRVRPRVIGGYRPDRKRMRLTADQRQEHSDLV
jgi:hypothetical protein